MKSDSQDLDGLEDGVFLSCKTAQDICGTR